MELAHGDAVAKLLGVSTGAGVVLAAVALPFRDRIQPRAYDVLRITCATLLTLTLASAVYNTGGIASIALTDSTSPLDSRSSYSVGDLVLLMFGLIAGLAASTYFAAYAHAGATDDQPADNLEQIEPDAAGDVPHPDLRWLPLAGVAGGALLLLGFTYGPYGDISRFFGRATPVDVVASVLSGLLTGLAVLTVALIDKEKVPTRLAAAALGVVGLAAVVHGLAPDTTSEESLAAFAGGLAAGLLVPAALAVIVRAAALEARNVVPIGVAAAVILVCTSAVFTARAHRTSADDIEDLPRQDVGDLLPGPVPTVTLPPFVIPSGFPTDFPTSFPTEFPFPSGFPTP